MRTALTVTKLITTQIVASRGLFCEAPTGTPLPHIVVNPLGHFLGVLIGKRWTRQLFPKEIKNEYLDLSLSLGVFGPIGHRLDEFPERCEQGLAGLLQPLPVSLGNVFLEDHLE